MNNPVIISCPNGIWKKISTGVTNGNVWRADKSPSLYLHTYRLSGDTPPTGVTEGMPIFLNSINEEIRSTVAIDVYIMAIGNNGKVRVDV